MVGGPKAPRVRATSALPTARPTEAMAPGDEVLLVLAVRGPMTCDAIASALGLGDGAARSAVEAHVRDGVVVLDASGRARLGASGTAAASGIIEREQRALGPATASLAEPFDALNRRVKAAITDWQVVRVGPALVPNDHTDARRDAAVIDRLAGAASAAAQLLRPLSRARRRIEVLLARLDAAISRVLSGGGEWVCGLGVDSVHSVWWNLHAELLAILGRERGEADA